MLKIAYNIGVQAAMAEYGLDKESTAWEGIKLLGGSLGGHLKDFFTAKKVREALSQLSQASGEGLATAIPRSIGQSVLSRLQQLQAGGKKSKLLPEAIRMLETQLTKSQYDEAKRKLLKSLIPYGVVGGGAGLGIGGYSAAKKLFPKAFKD